MKEIERKYGLVGRGARRGDGGRGDARRWISGEGAGRQWDGGGGHGGGSAERGRDDGWAKHDWGRGEGMAGEGEAVDRRRGDGADGQCTLPRAGGRASEPRRRGEGGEHAMRVVGGVHTRPGCLSSMTGSYSADNHAQILERSQHLIPSATKIYIVME